MRTWNIVLPALTAAALLGGSAAAQVPGFVYQGELSSGGTAVNGVYDLVFEPFSAQNGGVSLAQAACFDDLTIVNGRFTVNLPFTLPLNGGEMHLEIRVRPGAGVPCSNSAGLQTLLPRQKIENAPAALFASAIRSTAPKIRGALRLNDQSGEVQMFDGSLWRVIADLDTAALVPYEFSQFFDSPGNHTFTVPAGVTKLICVAHGGSGGGGARGPGNAQAPSVCPDPRDTFAGGGGGGEAGARGAFSIDVTPGESLTVIVGSAGIGRTNLSGTAGGTTRLRRGGTDILSVPGGVGGGRTTSEFSMTVSASGCFVGSGPVAGAAGNSNANPTLFGPGTVLDTFPTANGSAGRAPYCWSTIVIGGVDTGTCAGVGSSGGITITGVPFAQTQNPNGGGGNGTMTTIGNSGSPGSVRFFWN